MGRTGPAVQLTLLKCRLLCGFLLKKGAIPFLVYYARLHGPMACAEKHFTEKGRKLLQYTYEMEYTHNK